MNSQEALALFHKTFTSKSLKTSAATWNYFIGGSGTESLLALPGAFGYVEMGFDYLTRLSSDLRVIAVNYPTPVSTIDGLISGLSEVLDAEGFGQINVVGASFGGLVAQCLIRKDPTRIRKLILSHTGAPDQARGRRNSRIFRIVSIIPWPFLRFVLRKGMIRTARRFEDDQQFWKAYLTNVVDTGIDRQMLVSFCRRAVNFDLNFKFSPKDVSNASERVLILEANDDPLVKGASKLALKSLYPSAIVHTFHGTGHLASLLKPAEYAEVVRDYLLSRGVGAR